MAKAYSEEIVYAVEDGKIAAHGIHAAFRITAGKARASRV